MIVDTVKLSATNDNTILLTEETQVHLDGRPLRRSNTGGRLFIVEQNRLMIRLGANSSLRDQDITLTPPIDVVINDNQRYEKVNKLELVGDTIRIDCDVKALKNAAEKRFAEEIRELTEQENRLRKELAEKQQQIHNLERNKQEEEQRAAQLSAEVLVLQQRTEELMQANGTLEELQQNIAQVNADLAVANSNAIKLNQEFADRSAERDSAVRDNEVNAAAIKILEEHLADEKRRSEKLKQQEAELEEAMKEYSPAIIEALTSNIQELRDQLEKSKGEWTKLSGEKRVWQRQIEAQAAENIGIAEDIERQPEELRQLQEAHEALERRLTETIHAQQMCSEEKQKVLQEQIDEQEPIAQQLTEQYQALKERAEELTNTIAQQQGAEVEELIRLYPVLSQGFADIMQRVNDTNAELEQLQSEAAQFYQHISTCAERLESLREWYRVDKTPLQKLIERLGEMTYSENEQLMQTMNPMKVGRVCELFGNVEAGLTELDVMLKDVIKAAQKDEKFTNLRIATNDEFARREMKKQ